MKEIKIGLIGVSGRGNLVDHAHNPEDGVTIIAGADPCQASLDKFAAKYPGANLHNDYKTLLKRADINAVFICSPDYCHEDQTVAALEAGKAVYLEKPMAITIEGCDRILEATKKTGSKLYLGHNMRHFESVLTMKKIIDAGTIGDIQSVWCRHFISYGGDAYFKDWHSERKYSTGLLLQKGAHDIDVIHWLAGAYTRSVAFTGSFVFYQPRDIVSGDFYWYEQVDENRFIVVCADSTGHGVPGAFMSMIGTTLIKDICLRAGITRPSQVLTTLDNEVREALNQNVETSGSNDGMDIIVAEVDMRTNKIIISSAMRPVIIYSGGEQIYVKGSRSSIGGQLDEDRVDKDFIDQEFQLKKGDIVYMFSDGYPDQFGGPLGRKFKMVRLKNLLRDIHDKPMDEQYNYIKSNFFLWKEDLEQVDDVLFMGIRI